MSSLDLSALGAERAAEAAALVARSFAPLDLRRSTIRRWPCAVLRCREVSPPAVSVRDLVSSVGGWSSVAAPPANGHNAVPVCPAHARGLAPGERMAPPPPPGCRDWMQTFVGVAFRPLHPDPDLVDARDLAHHLAAVNRYTGATAWPYSVGEHACRVAREVWERATAAGASDLDRALLALAALLHDGSEAYLNDMVRPLKHAPELAAYRAAERPVQAAVYAAFGLPATADLHPWIKDADNALLTAEAPALLGYPPGPWGLERYAAARPITRPLRWWEAEEAFSSLLFALVDTVEAYGAEADGRPLTAPPSGA